MRVNGILSFLFFCDVCSDDFYSTDLSQKTQDDDAKLEETHQGATPGNRKLSFSLSHT